MKFVDEVKITVKAGNGGSGSASFRREKYVAFGGPDGGDGGNGGNIILQGDQGLNTLVDFRHQRFFEAPNGQSGRGRQMYGKGGEDLIVKVPTGTEVYDLETEQKIGDITNHQQQLIIAQGGKGGLGNMHFKSSVNRAPKRFTSGEQGQRREIKLELKVLADVGLLGFPNAGKSTFVNAISQAKPKIADYPFTTLYPALGVVRLDAETSFVVADIPGIIEGAAEGAGLGIQFLKHLQRTGLLLHMIELPAYEELSDPVQQYHQLNQELQKFSAQLEQKQRWLIFTKADTHPPEQARQMVAEYLRQINWQGKHHLISSIDKSGLQTLIKDIAEYLADPESHLTK